MGTNQSAGISGHTYYNASGQSQGLIYANSNELAVIGNNGLRLGSTSGSTVLQGSVNFTGNVSGLNLGIGQITGLQNEINALWSAISGKASSNHTHTVTVPNHNHGNPQNATSGGGTFTTSTP
ncbi:hypothetical protein P9222_20315 [Paenibacillus amylolyticus]|nr:hypothetical protein [Paenibacillus amylolyticus]WFR60876.1 hypothetical protein P9222_20315 [Paenibacillus amylolyticus]